MQVRLGLRASDQHTSERRLFRYPIEPSPTITLICDTLELAAGCTRIPEHGSIEPQMLASDTIAAPASLLLILCDGWMPLFPLVAFTGTRHGFLDNDDRERLWRRFAVPVFEQLLDDEGRLVAYECEAHAGLHVDTAVHHAFVDGEVLVNGRPTGVASREATGLCGCGRVEPRLVEASAVIRSLGTLSSGDYRLPANSLLAPSGSIS